VAKVRKSLKKQITANYSVLAYYIAQVLVSVIDLTVKFKIRANKIKEK